MSTLNEISSTLNEISTICQSCKKSEKSTRNRSIYGKDYQGPCGDSFCYASCEMSACRSVSVRVFSSKKLRHYFKEMTRESQMLEC